MVNLNLGSPYLCKLKEIILPTNRKVVFNEVKKKSKAPSMKEFRH